VSLVCVGINRKGEKDRDDRSSRDAFRSRPDHHRMREREGTEGIIEDYRLLCVCYRAREKEGREKDPEAREQLYDTIRYDTIRYYVL